MNCLIPLAILATTLVGLAQSIQTPEDYNIGMGRCWDPNAVWRQCASCPRYCGQKEPVICTMICKPGCDCKPGYILDRPNGRCIPESVCNGGCQDPNAEWTDCGTSCPKICGIMGPQYCNDMCRAGCQCKSGYILDRENGRCIPERSCKWCYDPNAEWTTCGTYCPAVCERDVLINCIAACRVGCQCKRGYILDQYNRCIPMWACQNRTWLE